MRGWENLYQLYTLLYFNTMIIVIKLWYMSTGKRMDSIHSNDNHGNDFSQKTIV